jgi:signal transduction histidine kinase
MSVVLDVSRAAVGAAAGEGDHGAGASPPLWRLLNTPRTFDPRTAQIACVILAVTAGGDALLRDDPGRPAVIWVRLAIAAYAVTGAILMTRLSFPALRRYTWGLAALLPLAVGWIGATAGNGGSELALTAACTFATIVFLQTGVDVLAGAVGIGAVHALLLLAIPPRHGPVGQAGITLVAAIATGTATALILIAYRARLEESLRWWREACERERAALRAKSEFLNTMSHELRSPLHVILGYTDLLREELPRDLHEALAHPLARVRGSALDLLQLVDHTLQAARLEAGKIAVTLEDVDGAALFAELAENVATLPEAKKGVAVQWKLPQTPFRLRSDRLKVKEIVQNLVSNALKYSSGGAVTVTVGLVDAWLRIEVADSGPGIPREALTRIFQMFERLDETGSRRAGGVGLGLYIVHGLVTLLGGRIAVESVVGEGSRFTVLLPYAGPEAAAA